MHASSTGALMKTEFILITGLQWAVCVSALSTSRSGQQPLSTPDGKYWIVFNGEIFNYVELKTDLTNLGYKFRTESDTEVLLYSYLEYGARIA